MKKFFIGLAKGIGFIALVLVILFGFIYGFWMLYNHPFIGFMVIIFFALLFLSVMVALAVSGWLKKANDFLIRTFRNKDGN